MSCRGICFEIGCTKRVAEAKRPSESRNRADRAMKLFRGKTRAVTMGVLFLQVCAAAFTQEVTREQGLGASPQSSPPHLTGAGTGNAGITAAQPGAADGTGNPRLGGDRRPLYRLNRSDVVAV